MGEITVTEPRVRLIKGSWYWQPTPAVKKLGFSAEPLGRDPVKAATRARELNAAVEKERNGEQPDALIAGSVGELAKLYRKHPVFTTKAPRTRKNYEKCLKLIEAAAARFLVRNVDRKGLVETYEQLIEARGLAHANAIMRVWRILMRFACDRGWRKDNPAAGMMLVGVPSRKEVWPPEIREAFCKTAIEHNRASLALALELGYEITQRETDIIGLKWSQFDGYGFPLIRQGKTDTPVYGACSPGLRAKLKSIKRTSTHIVVSEATGQPYKEDYFRHEVARIRKLAGISSKLQFRDLRRTSLTDAGKEGATDDELRALSGHKSRGVVAVYVLPDKRMAEAAARKRDRNKRRRKV